MDKTLLQVTENIGLNDKEAKVYLALLELSKGTVTQISKITELKRPIIYIVLGGLIGRGYVSQLPDKKINEYQALDPSVILNKVKTSLKNFSDFIPLLQTLHNKGEERPKINYVETKDGIWNMWNQMSYTESAFFITSYARISAFFPTEMAVWSESLERGSYNVKGKHLLPTDSENIRFGNKLKENNQLVKMSKDFQNLSMDFALYENKLVITSLEEQSFMVIIESQTLVDSMKLIFEVVWKNAKFIQ